MGIESIEEALSRKLGLFERCCPKDYASLLCEIQFCADKINDKSCDIIGEDIYRQDLESKTAVVDEHFRCLPDELGAIEPVSAHLSVLGELWEKYYAENWSFFEEGHYDRGFMYVTELGLVYTSESLLRCICLDEYFEDFLENLKESVLLMRSSRQMIESSSSMKIGINFNLGGLIGAFDSCFEEILSKNFCWDDDLAPVVVSSYLAQDLRFSVDNFLSRQGDESLDSLYRIRDISLVMTRLANMFNGSYARTKKFMSELSERGLSQM